MSTVARKFDLNIETVLEHWTVAHAIREIMANALDEHVLSETPEPQIYPSSNEYWWHIRDFGRGFRYEHLTQNENPEKLENAGRVIGKFGVGLKDALATFDRNGIEVVIRSRYGDVKLAKQSKHDFSEIVTLHTEVTPPTYPDLQGTDVLIGGASPKDFADAKSYFLKYSDERVIERTAFGEVLEKSDSGGRIYVGGLRIAVEPNFLFSYNITSPTSALMRALNRERDNVGRGAYSDRVKTILLSTSSTEIAAMLASDLQQFSSGSRHDELSWVDVATHATRILNATERVIVVSTSDLESNPSTLTEARQDGLKVVVVPDSLRDRLHDLRDIADQPVRTVNHYLTERSASFQFSYVDPANLTPRERGNWELVDGIVAVSGGWPSNLKEIRISETMRPGLHGWDAAGLWIPDTGSIILRRAVLTETESLASTLIHELAHARSLAPDISAVFESKLTEIAGHLALQALGL